MHVLVGVVLTVMVIGSKIWDDSKGSARPTVTTPFDHASALADLDGRKGQTAAYRAALDRLANACSNSEAHLSDMALTTRYVLQKRGTSEPLLTIPRLSIRATGDDPQFQQVSLTASSAIMKR